MPLAQKTFRVEIEQLIDWFKAVEMLQKGVFSLGYSPKH